METLPIGDSTRSPCNSIVVGDLGITLRYGSVYEECWVASMQAYVDIVIPDSLGEDGSRRQSRGPHRRADGCGAIGASVMWTPARLESTSTLLRRRERLSGTSPGKVPPWGRNVAREFGERPPALVDGASRVN